MAHATVPTKASALGPMTDDDQEMSPTRVRVGLAMIAVVIVVALGVLLRVDSAAVRFFFAAIVVIGLFQTWRIFRSQRRR